MFDALLETEGDAFKHDPMVRAHGYSAQNTAAPPRMRPILSSHGFCSCPSISEEGALCSAVGSRPRRVLGSVPGGGRIAPGGHEIIRACSRSVPRAGDVSWTSSGS